MNLKGKNAIITGGGSGLGKAVAIALANESFLNKTHYLIYF